MHNFKIGDLVFIKPKICCSHNNEYTDTMNKYSGTYDTIMRINDTRVYLQNSENYYWDHTWLEPVLNDIKPGDTIKVKSKSNTYNFFSPYVQQLIIKYSEKITKVIDIHNDHITTTLNEHEYIERGVFEIIPKTTIKDESIKECHNVVQSLCILPKVKPKIKIITKI